MELVSVLPTRHIATPDVDFVGWPVGLFFKKHETQQPTYDAGVSERCGVKIPVGEYEATLVVHCPDTGNRRSLEVEGGGTGFTHSYPIETRLTDTGPATSAICTYPRIGVLQPPGMPRLGTSRTGFDSALRTRGRSGV